MIKQGILSDVDDIFDSVYTDFHHYAQRGYDKRFRHKEEYKVLLRNISDALFDTK